jgi:hypothetical protein
MNAAPTRASTIKSKALKLFIKFIFPHIKNYFKARKFESHPVAGNVPANPAKRIFFIRFRLFIGFRLFYER